MSPHSAPSPGARAPIRRALLIVNPKSRRGLAARGLAMAGFRTAGVTCDDVLTNAPRHATEIARERAAAYDAVFTLGGDGTAMEVITALANGGPPVGILAGGTGNVLVRSLGIPIRPQYAVPQLLAGDEARIDLGELGDGRHFAIGVGVGLDEAMIAGASPYMKKRLGYLAYVWSALRAGLRLERFRVRLTVDGETRELEASSVLVANIGSVLGGLIHLGEGILYDDGVLHACVYAPRNRFEALRIFARMLHGTVQRDPRVLYMPGKRFRIETEPVRRAQADGELLEMTPIDITVRPRAARVLIPKESLRR